jgi:outer membrane protein
MPLIGGLPVSEEEAISLAMDMGPRAVSAQYRISAANYSVNTAVGDLLPQVNLVGVLQQQFDLQVPTDRYYTYGVRLQATVPIYQIGSEWSRIRQAKELVAQRRNELDSARRTAAENVIRAWRQLDSSRSRVTSFEAQVRANEVALNGVRQEALVGSRTTLDVLNAEQELLQARVNLVRSLATLINASYALATTIGRMTAQDLALPVQIYDPRNYYNAVRDRWFGTGDFSEPAGGTPPQGVVQVQTLPPTSQRP